MSPCWHKVESWPRTRAKARQATGQKGCANVAGKTMKLWNFGWVQRMSWAFYDLIPFVWSQTFTGSGRSVDQDSRNVNTLKDTTTKKGTGFVICRRKTLDYDCGCGSDTWHAISAAAEWTSGQVDKWTSGQVANKGSWTGVGDRSPKSMWFTFDISLPRATSLPSDTIWPGSETQMPRVISCNAKATTTATATVRATATADFWLAIWLGLCWVGSKPTWMGWLSRLIAAQFCSCLNGQCWLIEYIDSEAEQCSKVFS